jgi:L-fucose isomerase-like protein
MLGVFVISSQLGKQKEIGMEIKEKVKGLLKEIKGLEFFELLSQEKEAERISRKFREKISGCLIVVATGGTERIVRKISSFVKKPILIWANPFNNSLPSSLEAFSKLKSLPVKIFYSDFDQNAVSEIKSFLEVCESIERLKSERLGVFGEASKWPLTPENERKIRKLGPKVLKFKIEDLLEEVKKVGEKEVEELFGILSRNFEVKVEEKDLKNSIRVYLAIKRIISREKLSAVSVKCFDLLNYCSACLAISLLNDEGLTAGCEADLQACLRMLLLSSLTKSQCWMANSCRIDKNKNTLTLAHCTISTKMLSSKPILTSHMESGKFVALRGSLRNEEVTLVRIGGNLDKMLIAKGRIVKSDMQDLKLCRTQAEVELEGKVEKLIENSLGNHLILAYGNHESKLLDFCRFKGIEAIII